MDPAILTQVVTALTIIARIVDSLGVGGVIALALAGPVIVVLAVIIISYLNGLKLARIIEAYRADADARFEAYRTDSEGRFEAYRSDSERRFEAYRTQADAALKQYGNALGETREFYNNNVLLVQGFERMCKDFGGIVSLNATTMQKLADKIDTALACFHGMRGNK